MAIATAVQFFTNFNLRRIASLKSWVNIFTWSCELTFYYLTCQSLLHINVQILYLVNYGVFLLLGVVSLMAGTGTGVPMSSEDGGYQTGTPPYYYYTSTYDTTSYASRPLSTTPGLQIIIPQLMLP